MEIRNRRGFDYNPGGVQVLEDLLPHLRRCVHLDGLRAQRRSEAHRPRNQNHARAARQSRLGQRVAHFSAGTVGEVAHGVERLLGGPGGDERHFAFQVVARHGRALDGGGDGFGIGEPSRADHPASQVAALRLHNHVSALAQRRNIGLRGGVRPHVGVHGGRNHHRSGECQVEGGDEVVGQAVGHLGDQIRGGRRDHQQIVFLGDRDVFDGALDGEQVGEGLLAGQRGEGQRLHELPRCGGHGGPHLVAALHQQPRQFRGLVGRDAAAYAQNDLHAPARPTGPLPAASLAAPRPSGCISPARAALPPWRSPWVS